MNKKVGLHQPKRVENASILIANTPMDTDKIKVFGSRVQADSTAKVAELEVAEKEKMKDKVAKITKHGINVFINRYVRTCACTALAPAVGLFLKCIADKGFADSFLDSLW